MNKILFIKKTVAAAVAIVVSACAVCRVCPVLAYDTDNNLSQTDDYDMESDFYIETNSYTQYYDKYINEKKPKKEIVVRGVDYKTARDGTFTKGKYGNDEVRDDVLLWNSIKGKLTYEVYVPQTGIYNMLMAYCPMNSSTTSIELSVLIDGQSPYDTASRIYLNKTWVNKNEIKENSHGNQMRPSQVQSSIWTESDIKDVDGLYNDSLYFHLEQGRHEITFDAQKAYIALDYFKFYNHDQIRSYKDSEVSADQLKKTPSTLIRLEGENAQYKSDSTLYPTYDNASYLASPAKPGKIVYNTIGNDNWKKALQTITWVISGNQIKKDGWYRIGVKGRQKTMRGFYSNRRIYIDGCVPCSELDQVRFYYDNDWNIVSPQTDDCDDVYVYLTAGEDHTLTMEAIPGEIGESMRRLEPIVLDINKYYRKILMITGPNPDKYTDYNVDTSIPELVDEFTRISQELKDIKSDIEKLAKTKGSEASGIERMYVILDKCTDDPFTIPKYLKQLKDNVAAISAWMRDYKDQPLEVDYIELASYDREFSDVDESIIKSLAFGAKSFVSSFFEDYNIISEDTSDEVLDVWINLGRDQALAIKELVDSDFTPNYNIPVNLNIVQGAVIEATLAGKGPDIALYVGGELPVNLAARGLLTELGQFEGVDEITSGMNKDATVMYQYDGGLYGIPLEQIFPMMFYRKDILSETGLTSVPQTWDELIDDLPLLQRNYLTAGLVLPPANISPSTEAGHTFAMLMLQNGLNYYNEDLTQTCFNDINAVSAFETWTDFYTKYKFEQVYDPFSRFRDGTYPIVIQNYTFYNQLKAAAPELTGLWDFAEVPGTLQEDGTVSHAANSSGTGAIIFDNVKNKQDAWQFVKWFSSVQTQVSYGTEVEGMLGTMGRYASANSEVLKQLSWTPDETDKLLLQWSQLKEIPVTMASYSVTRNIMTAFRTVVNRHENPRDTIMWYNRDINDEISRKRQNLGLDLKS